MTLIKESLINSILGTPAGAGTVSLGVAFFLGSIMEMLGAVYLSGEVVASIAGEKSVVMMKLYQSSNATECGHFIQDSPTLIRERTLMLGLVTSMVASQIWQLIATYLAWPVSGTHTIISALMGFTLVEQGAQGINIGNPSLFNGSGIFKVIYGLLISPLFTLILTFACYLFIYKFSVKSKKIWSVTNKLTYSFCVFMMMMAITFTFASMYQIEEVEGLMMNKKVFGVILGVLVGFFSALLYFFFILPQLLKMKGDLRISFSMFSRKEKENTSVKDDLSVTLEMNDNVKTPVVDTDEDDESDEIKRVFRPLQIIAACFGALSHGSNDVGNCIGPLVTVWHIYRTPINYDTSAPVYGILVWGGLGIALGLVCFGERVIETMGSKISKVTPSLGFTVVMTSSIVVVVCSIAGDN